MPRIITRTSEEVNKELIEETAKLTAENLKKTLLEDSISGTGGSKVSQILRNASKGAASQQTDDKEKEKERIRTESEKESLKTESEKEKEALRIKLEREKENIEKELEDSAIPCPTCSHANHKHLLKRTDSGTLKCTDGECKIEYAIVPKDADYKCTNCGIPHKKPLEVNENDSCPMCGNTDFLKYDWGKLKKKIEK